MLSRRSFLAGALMTGLGARVRVTTEHRPVVIVGSGFGGGVSALRLAQAGIPVLVLERGIRWPTGPNSRTFPDVTNLDQRTSWLGSPTFLPVPIPDGPRFTGLLERVSGAGMDIMCAAGVGGGSLVYQGMSLQPSAEVFHQVLPEQLDYARLDGVHYPRVARMLRLATAPDELVDSPSYRTSRLFARNAVAAGYPVEKVPMPIDWSYALRELRGEMRPAYTNGDCALGVNNGGKHTVDVTYLAAAERTGRAQIAVLHRVTDLTLSQNKRWELRVEVLDTSGATRQIKLITADSVVLAAGSANTTRLLMRAANHATIPNLPDGLGTQWGSNADRIYLWTDLAEEFGYPQGGPVIYDSKSWSHPATANTVIQASLPPLPVNRRSTMLVGYGVSTGRGHFTWDAGKDTAVLQWPHENDASVQPHIDRRVRAIAGSLGVLVDTTALDTTTWHPLGGAPMGPVCDLAGRVHGHRGLYVLDGALIPGSTAACNPSLTIAAVVERAMDEIVPRDF